MTHKTTINLDSKEQHAILTKMAADLELFQTRGVGTGTVGNISELCKALADGRLIIAKAEKNEPS